MYFSKVLAQKNEFYSEYLGENIINLLDRSFDIPSNYAAHLYKVEAEFEGRPDLLSLDLYGDERYADVICKLNGVSNPYELAEGQYLLVPSLSSVDAFYIQPAQAWREPTSPHNSAAVQQIIPVLKKKTDKRKPNEAIVGDKRFNIDPISKIVIY